MFRKISRRELLKAAGIATAGVMLGACQPRQTEVGPVTEGAAATEGVAAPAERTTISFITPAGVGLERTMYTNFIYRFQEEHPNIKVDVSFEGWGDYLLKLPTIVAAGVTPEVMHSHWTVAMDFAYRGAFIDHTPYMERDGVDPDEFVPELLYEYAHGGKQYLLPKDSAINAVYLNLSRFDEWGVPHPDFEWTIDDWMECALLLTRDGQGRPANDPNFDATDIKQWGHAFTNPTPAGDQGAGFTNALGTHWWSDDYKTTHFDHDAVIEYWQKMADLRCKMRAMPSPGEAMGQGDQWRNMQFVAMTIGHHALTFFAKQESVQFEFDIRPQPRGPFGQFAIAASSGFGVSANARHQEEGWQLCNFLTSEETQAWIGEQKRWGVQRRAIMDAIDPVDGKPEHFPDVHTRPFMEGYDGPLTKIGMKAPVGLAEIRELYDTEMEPIFTCGRDNVAETARRIKQQADDILAQYDW